MTTNAEMLEQAQAQQVAREELAEWAELARRVTVSRDPLIRRVLRAGLSKSEVRRFTGLARTTIDRIADTELDPAAAGALEELRRKLAGDVD